MSIAAVDFLACAESLNALEKAPEAAFRSVVSRSYYAAYHDSRLWHQALPHLGNCPHEARGTHNRLLLSLANPHAANVRETRLNSARRGILLRKLHLDRVTADYEIHESVEAVDAAQAISDAKVIVGIA